MPPSSLSPQLQAAVVLERHTIGLSSPCGCEYGCARWGKAPGCSLRRNLRGMLRVSLRVAWLHCEPSQNNAASVSQRCKSGLWCDQVSPELIPGVSCQDTPLISQHLSLLPRKEDMVSRGEEIGQLERPLKTTSHHRSTTSSREADSSVVQ